MTRNKMRDIQRKAAGVRQSSNVVGYGVADIFGVCECLGYCSIRYPAGENGILGFAQTRDGDEIIFSNSSVRLAREIFTVAHEIGHFKLHMDGRDDIYQDNLETLGGINDDQEEVEANYFAACFLMPEIEVNYYLADVLDGKPEEKWNALDIANMMTAFNVSFDMVLNRLQNLGKLSNSIRNRIENEKTEKKVTNLLRMIGGNSQLNMVTKEKKIPSEYMEWVIDNYNHGVIPEETLKRALGYFDLDIADVSDILCDKQEEEDSLEALIGGMSD